ncbi:MAG: hypothetical protein EP318_05415 [Rhodobacteraceae bacterium]|nr:MAG: hypothetical protein EP318_05415 [Paracoccaceae bacterium]
MLFEDWLRVHGLEKYARRFAEHEIGLDILGTLTDGDLREIGLPMGARKRVLRALAGASGLMAQATPTDESERRHITVLFCDLVDYTGLSAGMDPEDLGALMTGFVGTCRAEVTRWGGQLGNYLGDGLLVYFGWPQAFEDAPQRAAHAALALVSAAGRLSDPQGRPLQVRIGMATGLVLVGRKLDAGAGDVATVFGETPNLAARLETLAAPGEVLLDAATAALLPRGRFARSDLGAQRLKGLAQPVAVWRLDGAEHRSAAPPDQGIRLGQAPIEGRETPLAQLGAQWRAVVAGRGLRLVTLEGEAGIGKSHMAAHFLRQCAAEGGQAHELHCWPFNDNATLYPVVAWLHDRAGVRPGDPLATRRAGFGRLARRIGIEAAVLLEDLGDLLDLAPTPAEQNAEKRRAAWFAAIAAAVRGHCARAPLLLVLEDLHWSDGLTERLIADLAESCADQRLMILATTRPGAAPDWSGLAAAAHLELSRLSREAAGRMVDHLALPRRLAPKVRERIVETSDGVPLFLAELTRDISDRAGESGADGAAVTIPATLQGVLSARLDSALAAKPAAQVASCIGRVFDTGLLARVMWLDAAAVQARIEALVDLALVEPLEGDAGRYIFRHALIQEAAYQSQPRARRRSMHGRIADALAAEAGADARLLGHHLTLAERFDEAIARWHEAGDRAVRRAALGEAIGLYRRGLELLDRGPRGPAQDRVRLALLLALGPVLSAHDGYGAEAVGDLYAEAARLADALGGTAERFAVRRGLWLYRQMSAQYAAAETAARDMLALTADRAADAASGLEARRALGATAFMLGKLDVARRHLETAIEGYAAGVGAGNTRLYGDDPGLACMAYLGGTLWYLGQHEAARTCCADQLRMARDLGHPFSMARSLTFSAFTYHLMEDYDLLLPTARQAALHADRYEFPFHSGVGRILWGWGLCRQGAGARGWAMIEEGYRRYAASGSHMLQPLYLSLMAGVLRDRGQPDEAWARSQQAMAHLDRSQEDLVKPEVLRLHGELLAGRGDRAGGLRLLRAAAALAGLQRSRFCALRALTSAVRLDPGRAQELSGALAGFPAGLEAPDIAAARAVLADPGTDR